MRGLRAGRAGANSGLRPPKKKTRPQWSRVSHAVDYSRPAVTVQRMCFGRPVDEVLGLASERSSGGFALGTGTARSMGRPREHM